MDQLDTAAGTASITSSLADFPHRKSTRIALDAAQDRRARVASKTVADSAPRDAHGGMMANGLSGAATFGGAATPAGVATSATWDTTVGVFLEQLVGEAVSRSLVDAAVFYAAFGKPRASERRPSARGTRPDRRTYTDNVSAHEYTGGGTSAFADDELLDVRLWPHAALTHMTYRYSI